MGALLPLSGKETITKGDTGDLHCSEMSILPTSAFSSLTSPLFCLVFLSDVIFRSTSGAWTRQKTRFHHS